MLRIRFGHMDNVLYGPAWFVNNYEPAWFADELVDAMIRDVDKSEYRGGELIYSEVLGPISPRDLSGGVKTLISILKETDCVFDATSCGPNCAKWLKAIGKREDVTINLNYPMPFKGLEPFRIHILNTDLFVETERDYILAAVSILHQEDENER